MSVAVIFLFYSFFAHGAALEGREQAPALEIVRLVFLIPTLLLLNLNPALTTLLIGNAIIALPVALVSGSRNNQILVRGNASSSSPVSGSRSSNWA